MSNEECLTSDEADMIAQILPDIPKDDRASRLARRTREPADDDVTSVSDRLKAFYRKCPNGRVHTDVTDMGDGAWLARAYVFDGEIEMPRASASATRSRHDTDEVSAEYPLETAETAAISRALRNFGVKP
ncbi:hypothetical protein [Microbacterium sp. YY-01]|uniref:hypothetical protein n=1 Tax=Microbacterium sp. YY-01 TaxID=3421634 RepID=UPI003D1714A5